MTTSLHFATLSVRDYRDVPGYNHVSLVKRLDVPITRDHVSSLRSAQFRDYRTVKGYNHVSSLLRKFRDYRTALFAFFTLFRFAQSVQKPQSALY